MNLASQRYRELQILARNTGRNTQELLTLYVLEGFLSRVVESPFRELLILKGGILLSALNSRRPTRDIDFAAQDLNNDEASVLKVCCEIASQIQNDGIVFNFESASAKLSVMRMNTVVSEYRCSQVSIGPRFHSMLI